MADALRVLRASLAVLVAALATAAVALTFNAWLVMLLVGVLHSQVPEVPSISLSAAVIVVAIYLVLAYKPDYHAVARARRARQTTRRQQDDP